MKIGCTIQTGASGLSNPLAPPCVARIPLALVATALLCWRDMNGNARGRRPHSDTGEQTMITIIDKRRSNWSIVSPTGQSPAVGWAVSELRRYLQEMTGCELEVSDTPTPDACELVVSLRASLSAADRALLPPPAEGYDGYAIVARATAGGAPPRIIIAGDNGRGAAYGVYDLLERFGCRWFYPTSDPADQEVVPRCDSLSLEPGAWTIASPLRFRICNGSAWYFCMNTAEAVRQTDWGFKCRYNMMGWQGDTKTPLLKQYEGLGANGLLDELAKREMTIHGPAHCFNLLLDTDTYMPDHPEWFGMRDGKRVPQAYGGAQFCWSNADARKELIRNAVEFIAHAPLIQIFMPAPFDGGICCACPDCQRQGAGNLLALLANELTEEVAAAAPHAFVEASGGYAPVNDPPSDVTLHPKLRIVYVHWGRHHGRGYAEPAYDRIDTMMAWRRAARDGLNLCQYYTDNFASPWIAPPYAIAMISDRQWIVEHNADSIYMLMWSPGYWWNHSLNGYLAGRCFYDFTSDPFAGIRDYALRYFGPEAGPLLGDYYDQWAREIDLAYRVKDYSQPVHRAMLAEQRRKWIDPAVEAVKGDAVLAHRVGKVEKLHALAERLTEAHRQRDELWDAREAGDFDRAAQLLHRVDAYTASVLEFMYGIADLNQGLLDRNEIPSFITANIRGWIEGEAKAVADRNRKVERPWGWKPVSETDMLPSAVTDQ
jgi:hypothetical protein